MILFFFSFSIRTGQIYHKTLIKGHAKNIHSDYKSINRLDKEERDIKDNFLPLLISL